MHPTVEFVMPQREKNFRRKPDMKLDVVAIIPKRVVLVVTMETDFLSVRTVGSIMIIVHSHKYKSYSSIIFKICFPVTIISSQLKYLTQRPSFIIIQHENFKNHHSFSSQVSK